MEEADNENEAEDKIRLARTVYLLMKKDYRISRNIRASWFFNHINAAIQYCPKTCLDECDRELTVLSVVTESDGVDDDLPVLTNQDEGFMFRVLPSTVLDFIAKRYRLVFVLDFSPSSASVDLKTGEVLYDKIFQCLRRCLTGLVKPFLLPGTNILFHTELYITVIAYTPVLACTANQVLSQGYQITEQNVDSFLSVIKEKLHTFEQNLASDTRQSNRHTDDVHLDSEISVGDVSDDDRLQSEESVPSTKSADPPNNLEGGIINLVRQGIFALQLLPENSSAGIVVVTDGMLGVTDHNQFDTVLNQLRSSTTSCSFLQIGQTYCPRTPFGHVPHVELLQFIATATFGAYFSSCPEVPSDMSSSQLNIYHKALLLWSFQKGLEGFKYDLTHHRYSEPMHPTNINQRILCHPIRPRQCMNIVIRKKYQETRLAASISSVLAVRLREGYTIKNVQLSKGDSLIEVHLVLPWRDFVKIEYYAKAEWPPDPNKRQTSVEIIIEGSYHFLHDVFANECLKRRRWRSVRIGNVKRFLLTLQKLCQYDQLLVHLQSFGTNPVHYKLSDSIKNGLPVFHLSANSNTPVLNAQHNTKDSALNQFSSFWMPVVNLDVKIWQKWMHCHKIGVVLEHDTPLPKYLHIPNASGRFSIVTCRQALTSLHGLLQKWSTFVLIDGSSYIKFLDGDAEKSPSRFLLLRLTSKPPCMMIRVAFLGGTSGAVRHRIIKDLKKKVLALKFPQRGTQKVERTKKSRKDEDKGKEVVSKPPLLREWSEIACCVLLTKPVEHILISYDRKPRDMTILEDPSKYVPTHTTRATVANAFNTLSRYLHHQRWIWTVKQGKVDISMQAVGRVLTTLTKMRLQEGFHFALSNSGIVNMVLEVEMVHKSEAELAVSLGDPTRCVVQYIMFPPHIKTTRASLSEDDMDEYEATEADGELQLVTECWIEPQYGVAVKNSPERRHWDGLDYKGIARTFYPKDLECISCLVTFDNLVYVCEHNAVFNELPWTLDGSFHPDLDSSSLYRDSDQNDNLYPANIHCKGFPFNLLSLLPKSQQAELLFSAFALSPENSEDIHRDVKGSNSLLIHLLHQKLKDSNEREIELGEKECKTFLTLLQNRDRDNIENPFPFPIERFIPAQSTKDSEGNGNNVNTFHTDGHKSASQANLSGIQSLQDERSEEKVPAWKCFVKSMKNANRLFLTFLPASFDDLLLLVNEEVQDRRNESFSASTLQAEVPPPGMSAVNAGNNVLASSLQDKAVPERNPEGDGKADAEEHSTQSETEEQGDDEGISEKETLSPSRDDCMTPENQPSPPNQTKLLVIPVYVYECYSYNITDALVNPWNFKLPPDIYEDKTFQVIGETDDTCPVRSPMLKRMSSETERTGNMDDRDDAYTPAHFTRINHERRSTENSDSVVDLKQHCVFITEAYHSCFVHGVFQSLQQGYYIDQQDVNATINNICTESLPIEMDITTFLHASCRHFQQMVEGVKEEMKTKEVEVEQACVESQRKPSVRFSDLIEEEIEEETEIVSAPSVLKLPCGKIKLEIDTSQPCEQLHELHSLIKSKFMDITQRWFKVVPTDPNFYFYCPESVPTEESEQNPTDESDSTQKRESTGEIPENFDDSTVFQDPELNFLEHKVDFLDKKSNNPDIASIASQLDSEESFNDSDYDFCEDLPPTRDDHMMPLFLHFTCTVKDRTENENVSVTKLVPCLEELVSSFSRVLELSLGQMKITFDINCLTYPSDEDEDITIIRQPSFHRSVSNTSHASGSSDGNMSPPPEHDADASTDMGPLAKSMSDPIAHLPRQQHDSVLKFKEELEWLLTDEIASSLLQIKPVRADTLHFVIEHIKQSSSKGKPTCSHEKIPLLFVYGAEHSLKKFNEEFERLQLHGFRLIQEENFYYCVRTKAHNLSLNASALNTALVELSREGTPAIQSSLSLNDLNQEDSLMSSEAGVLRTYVSPAFISPEYGKLVNQNASVQSSDLSEDSAHYLFPKSSSDAPYSGSTKKTVEGRKPSFDVDTEGRPRVVTSRRSSKESSGGSGKVATLDIEQILNSSSSNAEDVTDSKGGQSKQEENSDGSKKDNLAAQPPKSPAEKGACLGDSLEDLGLRKSSSFAGFRVQPCQEPVKQQESYAALPPLPTRPLMNLPQLPSLGRLRHSSAPEGQGTPRSKTSTLPQTPSWISSRGSYTEEGYDGDSSESGDGTTAFSDVSGLQQPVPKFWLIMQINKDSVDIYYHCRETGQIESDTSMEQRNLLTNVKKSVEGLCRKVNQQLLLNDLYETRMCKKLLVPEADEDVSWNVDKSYFPGNPPSLHSDESEEELEPEHQYLAVENKYLPGHFECDCVMTHQFLIHPRLKTVQGRALQRGVQVLRTILNRFSVNNRVNMFVIKETETHAVFYLRLKEYSAGTAQLSRQMSSISTEELRLSDSASSLMLQARKDDPTWNPDRDADTLSITSTGSLRVSQDMIELHVHGIQPAGKEIQTDLVQLLQNKLDESVLDVISVQLSRNPMTKLSPDDVNFIQGRQEARRILQYTIPSHAMNHLHAFNYYLRQNLLTFSHTPNYSDSRTESKFQDRVDNIWQAIPDDQVFLYITPHASGGKGQGIACIRVCLVDGQGNSVRMLGCHKPSRTGYTYVQNITDFQSLLQVDFYSPGPMLKPGPTALIQFKIWEKGSADTEALHDKLLAAVVHTLCDIVTEYNYLTAPVCSVPHQLQDLLPAPVISAPSSPLMVKEPCVEKKPPSLSRKNSIDSKVLFSSPSKQTDKLVSPSPLQSFKEAFSAKRLTSPPPDSNKTFEIPSVAPQPAPTPVTSSAPPNITASQRGSDIQQVVRSYEEGERGTLHPVYREDIVTWLDLCAQQGVPSVTKESFTLSSVYSRDHFLREFQSSVKGFAPDIHPKIFKMIFDSEGNYNHVMQYAPCRHHLQTTEYKAETSLDYGSQLKSCEKNSSYVVIGRNVDQWLASIQDMNEDELAEISMGQSQKDKAFPKQSSQRFPPYLSEAESNKSALHGVDPVKETVFIPRQRLIYLTLCNDEITLYTYNWAKDMTSLNEKITRLVNWNNARKSLMDSIVAQKMGLFYHSHFVSDAKRKNSYTTAMTDIDYLIMHTAPPGDLKRHNSMLSIISPSVRTVDQTLRYTQPSRPLQQSRHAKYCDPVKRHGCQAQEIRMVDKRETERLTKLNKFFFIWTNKSSVNIPISDDVIHVLKQSSRLFHYCATPLLFDPYWRHKVLEKYKVTQRQSSSEIERSRHSSGASISSLRTKRADSQEGKKRPSVTPTDSPVNDPASRLKAKREEAWHFDLRMTFVQQYIQYVQSLGFVLVQTRPCTPRKGSHAKKPSLDKIQVIEEEVSHIPSGTTVLHKFLSAGVMLMELSFSEQYFCVKLFVCESTRLGVPVNKQLENLFVDECIRCKDMIHVHSFAHDFHLRCIQSFIQSHITGSQAALKQYYHLTGFLTDFTKVYPYPPKYSRNVVVEDAILITDLSSSGNQLFDYIIQHQKIHGLKVVAMAPTETDVDSDFYFIRGTEHALIQQKEVSTAKHCTNPKQKVDEFHACLVITQDSQQLNFQIESDRHSLRLNYFLILTSKVELFPTADRKGGEFKDMILHELSRQPKPVKHIGVRRVPHTVSPNILQTPVGLLLMEEAEDARKKMYNIVEVSTTKCRKDLLWQRMLVGDQTEEDGKRKKRSETEESKDGIPKLSFEEFLELMEMTSKTLLSEIDNRLVTLQNMSMNWYRGLYRKLQSKYPETHRCFISADGLVQYIVILNPNLLDMLMMLKIDSKGDKAELSSVFKEPLLDQLDHSDTSRLAVVSYQSHTEDFVNVCCFYLWSTML